MTAVHVAADAGATWVRSARTAAAPQKARRNLLRDDAFMVGHHVVRATDGEVTADGP